MSLIDQIARDGRYLSICKKLAKREHLADDLLQEFRLAICEMGNEKLEKHREHIEIFCVGIINNIWNKYSNQLTIKKNVNGATSPLFEFSKYAVENPVFVSTGTYDVKVDYIYKWAKDQIERDIVSKDTTTMAKSRTFAYSLGYKINPNNGKIEEGGKFKNARDFSIQLKGEYHTVYKQYKSYQKRLKEFFKKYIND